MLPCSLRRRAFALMYAVECMLSSPALGLCMTAIHVLQVHCLHRGSPPQMHHVVATEGTLATNWLYNVAEHACDMHLA
jgi:hypothetical protein